MAKKYQNYITDDVRQRIWDLGQIQPLNLFKIAAWKSAKGLAELTLNSEDDIAEATSIAVSSVRTLENFDVLNSDVDWAAWESSARIAIGVWNQSGLMKLRGVGYPMATAILCALLPRTFPVMDKWALSGLFGITEKEAKSTKWHHASEYKKYTQALVNSTISIDPDSIHFRDQYFMAIGMGKFSANSQTVVD